MRLFVCLSVRLLVYSSIHPFIHSSILLCFYHPSTHHLLHPSFYDSSIHHLSTHASIKRLRIHESAHTSNFHKTGYPCSYPLLQFSFPLSSFLVFLVDSLTNTGPPFLDLWYILDHDSSIRVGCSSGVCSLLPLLFFLVQLRSILLLVLLFSQSSHLQHPPEIIFLLKSYPSCNQPSPGVSGELTYSTFSLVILQ